MAPNLDSLSIEELAEFYAAHTRPRSTYKTLFPAGGKGTVNATNDLRHYACNKMTAMICRKKGSISAALVYEDICENIYSRLPAFAKW